LLADQRSGSVRSVPVTQSISLFDLLMPVNRKKHTKVSELLESSISVLLKIILKDVFVSWNFIVFFCIQAAVKHGSAPRAGMHSLLTAHHGPQVANHATQVANHGP
jgi:hypothetical protein